MIPAIRFRSVLAISVGVIVIAVSGALAQNIPGAAEQTWVTYTNARFGVQAPVPQLGFIAEPPPANGDGQAYVAAQGEVRVSVSGSYWDVLTGSFDSYRRWLRGVYRDEHGAKITYEPYGETWFVLSGYLPDGRVFYQKIITETGCSVAGQFYVEFTEEFRDPMETIIGHMEDGLRMEPAPDCAN